MANSSDHALKSLDKETFFQTSVNTTKVSRKPIKKPDLNAIGEKPDRPTKIVDDVFDPIVTQTVETIGNFVKPIVTDYDDKTYLEQEMLSNIYSIIHIMETVERKNPIYEMIVKTTFLQLKYLCRLVNFMNCTPAFLILVKALFHRYIAILGHTDLIEIYDDIFTDGLYADKIKSYVFVPILTEEWRMEKIKEYQESVQQAYIRKNAKKAIPKYEINEIVGAKDKEGRWWLSKVLAVYEYNKHVVYYVEFVGWGEKFNEFISDGFRLQKYNPKKHRYFRPAWSAKQDAIQLGDLNTNEDDNELLIEQDVTELGDSVPVHLEPAQHTSDS